jgi:transcription initiation factor IIE alpha subunit
MKVINFVQENKKVLKKLTPEQQEDIIVIIIDEMLEKMGIEVNEEQIEKILLLLKNSLLVQNVINYLIRKTKKLFTFSCTSA